MVESTDNHKLIVSLEARIRSYEKNLERAQSQTNQRMRGIEVALKRPQAEFDRLAQTSGRTLRKMETDTARSTAAIGASFKNLAGGFAAGLLGGAGLQAARQLVDTATRIRNSLKVAGLEGENLTAVYGKLFASAQKNAAPLETLVTLYSRVAQAQDSLGVSQQQIIGFTDKIALALRVAGTDAQTASGALLQLGQALGAGTVRAEEFNSINEGARPILQAVAAGLKEAGGSVSTLRQLVLDGKLSSEAFFRAFEAGAGILETKVAGAELTVSQAFVRLQNVLIDLAGKLDGATGASTTLANFLSNDLTRALQEVGGVFQSIANGPVGDFVGFINSATDAIVRLSARLGNMTGLDKLGAALGATPVQGGQIAHRTAEQIRADIAALEKDKALTGSPGILQGQIDQLQDELAELYARTGGPSARGGRDSRPAAGTSGASTAPKQISITDYPVEDSGSGSNKAGGLAKSVTADAAANSFDRLNEAVRRFVDNVVKAESGGNANARNPLSSATGLGQFIESTWLDLFKRHFPDRAKGMADGAILALRTDAEVSRSLIEAYAKENAAILRQASVSVNEAALHLAHFLGPQGAVSVLKAAPGTPVSSLLGRDAIAANPSILGGGATTDDVIAYAQRRAAANAEVAASLDGISASSRNAANATEELGSSYDALGEIGIGALRGLANALSDGKLEGRELLAILFDIVEQLLRMPAAGAGSGGGNILGSLLGAIVGGIKLADGGKVLGPGGPRSDKIPAMLSNGEFVVNSRSTSKHRALLEAINAGTLSRFAEGGAAATAMQASRKPNGFAAILQQGERLVMARDAAKATRSMHGLSRSIGKGVGKSIPVTNNFFLKGAISGDDVLSMIQSGFDKAVDTAKRSYPDWEIEFRRNGAFS